MSDLRPGRELDALVAERVMGCTLWRRDEALQTAKDQKEYEAARRKDEFRCECPGLPHHESNDDGESWLKAYSTDIAAAWEVVDAVKTNDGENGIYDYPRGESVELRYLVAQKIWSVTMRVNGGGYVNADADTAPHAICLAALKVVGHGR